MTSKEAMNKIQHHINGTQLSGEEILECYEIIFKDLDRLEQIDNAKPSEALEILETFDGGLLNKEIGAISYNQIWLENQIKALKQALLKAQKQDAVLEVLEKGIFYFDKFGKVIHLHFVDVNTDAIKGKRGTRQIYFKWEDLNKKFFLDEESATIKANEYLDKLKELNITLSLIKKVFKFVKDFNRYSNSSTFFEKVVRGDKTYICDTTPDYCFFDKDKLALICEYEYDDDYGGRYTKVEYSLKDYKITWAFKESDLKELLENDNK